jgi:hypothetical protein
MARLATATLLSVMNLVWLTVMEPLVWRLFQWLGACQREPTCSVNVPGVSATVKALLSLMLSQYAACPAKPSVPGAVHEDAHARPRVMSQVPAGSLPERASRRSIQKSVPELSAS